MIGLKIYYGLRWLGWNVAYFALAAFWLLYRSAYAGNALRFLMAFALVAQVIGVVGFDLASDDDREKATRHLVFSESVYGTCNFTSDLALALILATYGYFLWAAVGTVSLILTGAMVSKSYEFRARLKKEVKPEPECGCQHCN